MSDREECLTAAPGKTFGHRRADDEPPDQTRPCCRGNAIKSGERHLRLIEGPYDDLVEMVEMWGPTPPYGACSAICAWTTLERILGPEGVKETTAAAVSSQLVSMPRTI